jgi:hypothetical protein
MQARFYGMFRAYAPWAFCSNNPTDSSTAERISWWASGTMRIGRTSRVRALVNHWRIVVVTEVMDKLLNNFQTEGEKNEQRGIWYLFKGVVGLRNFKAHVVSTFDDPHRAHEYLALASLLMRLLDTATIDAKRASLFRRRVLGGWKAVTPLFSPSCLRYQPVVENLLPRLGSVILAELAPPPVSPSGVCCHQEQISTPISSYLGFGDVSCFSAEGCRVMAGSRFVCAAGTAKQAGRLASDDQGGQQALEIRG